MNTAFTDFCHVVQTVFMDNPLDNDFIKATLMAVYGICRHFVQAKSFCITYICVVINEYGATHLTIITSQH